jgi:phage terminase large subunit GpA-like protein
MSFVFKFDTVEEMLARIADNIRPSERLTVSQAATKYRMMREATHTGPWDNTIAPYLVDIMDEMESLEFNSVCFAGPARCGKSDIFFNWLAYATICDPGDIMLVHMTQSTARDWSQGDLRKMLYRSKAVEAKVLPGKQNLNTHDVRFSTMRLLIKWPTVTEVSGKTLRRTWIMDHDRIPLDIDGEGAIYDLTKKRTQTFGRHAMSVVESSPGYEVTNHRWIPTSLHEAPPTEGILSIYNRGDRRRWYWFCANEECGEPFEGNFKNLNWPPKELVPDPVDASEMVTMDCPHCGFSHTHDAGPGQPGKWGLNQTGRWVKDGQKLHKDGSLTGIPARSDIASFWLKGVAAAFVTWPELVRKYLQAMDDYARTGDTGALKTTINTDQGEPFTPPSLAGDRGPEELMERAIDWEYGRVPYGVRYLTATIDVQKNKFVVQVHGHGIGGDTYVVDRFDIKKSKRVDEDGEHLWVAPHAEPTDWHTIIDEVIEKTYPLEDGSGRVMRLMAVGCDSGGREGVTTNAYEFWRYLRDEHPGGHHRRFQLIKGGSQKNAPRAVITFPDSERKDRRAASRGEVPVLMINTDIMKDQVNGLLGRKTEFSGRIVFPTWLPTAFFVELTVETKTARGWENLKKLRNEAWDLLVYDYALGITGRHITAEAIDWEHPPRWAEDWDSNTLVFAPVDDTHQMAPESQQSSPTSRLAELAKRLA